MIRHISKDPKYDKYDNIIALCPNHHTQFDKGCFYIDSESRSLVSFSLTDGENGMLLDIDYVDKRCLAYRQYNVMKAWNEKFHRKDEL